MIHTCFCIHDSRGIYCKYLAVAVCSLLENTSDDVTVHIIHDETLTENDRAKFDRLVASYGHSVSFYRVSTKAFLERKVIRAEKIGTFMRLKIADVLPASVDRVVYLDSDVVLQLDIRELWESELTNNVLGACIDQGVTEGKTVPWLCEKQMVKMEKYFNAGVLLMDLTEIRRGHNLFDESVRFLEKYPRCTFLDQDALNYIFRDKTTYIEDRYNTLTVFSKEKSLAKRIYHFAGDSVNIGDIKPIDAMFFYYLLKTPWGTLDGLLAYVLPAARHQWKQIETYQKILEKADCKKIIFGANGEMNKEFLRFFTVNPKMDYYVDNCLDIQDGTKDGMPVFAPSKIRTETHGAYIVIVLSKDYYRDIKHELEGYGLKENKDFFDGRLLLKQDQNGYSGYY